MGGGIEPLAAAGVATTCLSAGGGGLFTVLQGVPTTGYRGLGTAIYDPSGRAEAVRGIATSHLEGGVELVF